MLSKQGYTVDTSNSSLDALAFFRSHASEIDLVITDMTMPKMTGDQLAKALHNIRPDIPIILCTGYSERISGDDATTLGVTAFLKKPIQFKDMALTVKQLLDQK